jgi:16S rRNA C1402 (ribose-2'-O) methylase RsmI
VLAKPQDFKGECVVILEGCKEIAITDAEITSHLSKAMEIMSLKDSVELVSNSLKQPKKAVYTLALQIKKK